MSRATAPSFGGEDRTRDSAARERPETISVVLCVGGRAFLESASEHIAQAAGMQLAGSEIDLAVALDLVDLMKPSIAVMDSGQLSRADDRTLHRLSRAAKATRMLLHPLPDAERMIRYVAECGVKGALSQRATGAECVKAIRAVHRGELWLSRETTARVLERLVAELHGHESGERLQGKLTERESQIVKLLKDGYTDKEVGQTLGISPTTVKTHVGNVFGKMGIWRRAQL